MTTTEKAPNGSKESGNTKRIPASKNWCFTLHFETEKEKEEMIILTKKYGSKFITGLEKCPTTGRAHLQGYVQFESKKRPMELFPNKRIHWEKAKGSLEANVKYCSKELVISTNVFVPRVCKIIKDLYQWQKELLEILIQVPDERTIYWIWEKEGKCGKTSFSKYLSYHHNAIVLEGKKNDILFCAANFETDIYIYDIERSLEDYVSYSSIEKIKNGFYMCAKYESKPIMRACPHVVIFANFAPDRIKLSQDRWKVFKIQDERLVSDYTTIFDDLIAED